MLKISERRMLRSLNDSSWDIEALVYGIKLGMEIEANRQAVKKGSGNPPESSEIPEQESSPSKQ